LAGNVPALGKIQDEFFKDLHTGDGAVEIPACEDAGTEFD